MFTQGAVEYDFQYYSLPMPTDFSFMCLCSGRSAIVRTGCDVLVQQGTARSKEVAEETEMDAGTKTSVASSLGPAEAEVREDSDISLLRAYIRSCLCLHSRFSIAPPAAARAEQLFVQRRATEDNAKQCDGAALHRWLTLGRSLAISHGRWEMTPMDIERSVAMEEERLGRLVLQ